MLHCGCVGTNQTAADGSSGLTPPLQTLPLKERSSELSVKETFLVGADLVTGAENPTFALDRLREEFCRRALAEAEKFFANATGSEEYYKRHVGQLLTWLAEELTTNELFHGVLEFDSRDKSALHYDDSILKSFFGEEIDPQEKRRELNETLLRRLEGLGSGSPISLEIETGFDTGGRSFMQITVGAKRNFDLAAALEELSKKSVELDALLEAGQTDPAKMDEFQARMSTPWGHGLEYMAGKVTEPGDFIGQDPAVTGPVRFRKILPHD